MTSIASQDFANPPGTISDGQSDIHRFACHEIWGGNKAIQSPVELPGIRGYIYSRPVEGSRGGDVHYLSVCGSGLLSRICVADVVGHGETVATISAIMHKNLRQSMNRSDQRSMLAQLNSMLFDHGVDAMTTAAAFSYFPPTKRLSVSYAGHEPAWFFDSVKQEWKKLAIESPRSGLFNLALAVEKDVRFNRRKFRVRTGDRLALVTDGLFETLNPNGEQFGQARLQDSLMRHRGRTCREAVNALIDEVTEFAGGTNLLMDDITLGILEFTDNLRDTALRQLLRHRLLRKAAIVYRDRVDRK